jgi:hypothetical protein
MVATRPSVVMRAQAHHLVDVHEAVLEDGLGHHAGAFGHQVQRHELGLHIGGKARIFGGAKALGLELARGHLQAAIHAPRSRPHP